MQLIAKGIIIYLLLINLLAFVLFGIDKQRARKNLSRVSENSLFLVAVFCGSVGAWSGMYFFRHKTKHLKFVLGMPLLFIAQVILFLYLLK